MAVVPMPVDVALVRVDGVSESLPELRLLSTRMELIDK